MLCPYCKNYFTETDRIIDRLVHYINIEKLNYNDEVWFNAEFVKCPNSDCNELMVIAELRDGAESYKGHTIPFNEGNIVEKWCLKPQYSYVSFPEYVPKPIREDYYEACKIQNLSPKAASTLARRALQGIIRDFWEVKGDTLKQEIEKLEGIIDPDLYNAIDAVRSMGNIGAHMEKDVSLVIDISPNEAAILIQLIESLIEDTYVSRHKRQERMKKIVNISEEKKIEKSAPKHN